MSSADGEGSTLPLPAPEPRQPDIERASRLAYWLYSASEYMAGSAGEENPRPARAEQRAAVA